MKSEPNTLLQPVHIDWQQPLTAEQIDWVQESFFDRPVNRENSFAEKYDLRQKLFGTENVLPMWVADMDLPTPPFIIEALHQRLQHPILGYNLMPDLAYQAIIDWQNLNNYDVKKSEILFTHNVANGFHLAIQASTRVGDSVVVLPPVYPPFMSAPENCGRQTLNVPLIIQSQGGYTIDFNALESALQKPKVTALLFCHPHNPVGHVWQKHELIQLAQLCLQNNVVLISDEIHSDLILTGRHIPIASLSDDIAQNTITLSSPGKTFNLGGLQLGYAIIANSKLRQGYQNVMQQVSIHDLNTFALHSLIAAYSPAGQNWRLALLAHINTNFETLRNFLQQYAPEVDLAPAEATYLAWLNFSAWKLPQKQLKHWLVTQAKLGLSNGDSFFPAGTQNTGWMRMNLAVSKQTLQQALNQLQTALERR